MCHRLISIVVASIVLVALPACESKPRTTSNSEPIQATPSSGIEPQPQATSLLGEPLFAPELPVEVRMQREVDLYKAQLDYDANLHDETAIIWLGRRQAYLGDYRAAIDTFSNGLAIEPNSFRLLRHRGHRYITVREFDKAIADLSRAAELIQGLPDETEPDGQPNAAGIPTSTTFTNIYYHLGLAHYLKGEWSEAANAWRKCHEISANDDMKVAAAYWLFLSLRRADDTAAAEQVLGTITADMNVIENASYWKLLRVFKGELEPDALEAGDGVGGDRTIDFATIGYGLGVRDLLHGHEAPAREAFEDIILNTNWAAFGHIAAEAELARLRK